MKKKLVFVYESNGIGNAKRKLDNAYRRGNKIGKDDFEFLSIQEFVKSKWLNPDFLILEDEAPNQIELIMAASYLDDLHLIVVCDSLLIFEEVIAVLNQSPKVITLDYKIGANKTPENLPAIYLRIRNRFKSSAIIGYTNYGRKKADKEFSAKSADELTELLRSNGESVIEKSEMNEVALSSILFDRMQVQKLRKKLIVSENENRRLKKVVEEQDNIFTDKIKMYIESNTMRNLERPIIGSSIQIRTIKYFIEKYAKSDTPVLIFGKRGTGKELIARAIHRLSKRGIEKKFIAVDCGSIPKELFESELFGYEKGAHNQASELKKGYIEGADKGTLFLDEIGNLDYVLQTKLLRALQEKKIKRLGSNEEIPVDFRLISATNKDLLERIAKGEFHDDLYSRIDSYFPTVPTLSERKEDIPELIDYFAKKYKAEYTLTQEAIDYMCTLQWDGNIRELERFIENLCTMFENESISKRDVAALIYSKQSFKKGNSNSNSNDDCSDAEVFLDKVDSIVSREKHNTAKGIKQNELALDLGITRNSLYEQRLRYTPCIEQLMESNPTRWANIRSSKFKLTAKKK